MPSSCYLPSNDADLGGVGADQPSAARQGTRPAPSVLKLANVVALALASVSVCGVWGVRPSNRASKVCAAAVVVPARVLVRAALVHAHVSFVAEQVAAATLPHGVVSVAACRVCCEACVGRRGGGEYDVGKRVGDLDAGSNVGDVDVGRFVGLKLGVREGLLVGERDAGNAVGDWDVGGLVGVREGLLDGVFDGLRDGALEGLLDGCLCCRLHITTTTTS